jgi:cytochrome c-type biogenesis protein CcmH/NrfG
VENMSREDSVVYDHLGDTYLKLNRIPQALEAWQKASVLEPENKKLAEKIDNAKTKVSKGQPLSPNPMD